MLNKTEDRPAEGDAHRSQPPVAAARRGWGFVLLRIIVSLVLVAAAIGTGIAVQRHLVATRSVTPKTLAPERPRPIGAITAKPADVQPTLRLFGQIVAGRSVDLRVLVGGEAIAVSPRLVEGGRVAAGDVLVTVEPFDYEGAVVRARTDLAETEAQIREAEARIAAEEAARLRAEEQERIAGREVERLTRLEGQGATSPAALDASKSRMSVAMGAVEARVNQMRVLEAQVARLKASLDRLRWNVRKAERDLASTRLVAPFEGIVSNVAAEVGRLLNVNDRVATLVDLDRFEVRFTLSDAQYGRVVGAGGRLEGRPVTVRWGTGGPVIEARGAIDRVSPVVASASGGFEVFARLVRSEATEAMRPGAFVAVETADVTFADVVRLPQSAVHPGGRVFVVGPDNRLIEIAVTVAGFDGDAALVRGKIPAGATLMTSRLPDAGPGVLVEPRKAAP